MKSKPLASFGKLDDCVERLFGDCVHGTETVQCAKLDSDQVRVASIEGGFNYLSCLFEKQVGKHLNSYQARCARFRKKHRCKGTRRTKALSLRGRAAVARQAHNLEVAGSNPAPAPNSSR